jgi:hypothetical protein
MCWGKCLRETGSVIEQNWPVNSSMCAKYFFARKINSVEVEPILFIAGNHF